MADIAVLSERTLSKKERLVSQSLLLTSTAMDTAKHVEFIVDMDDKTFLDEDMFLDVKVEGSDDGVKWRLMSGFTWRGGPKYFNDGTPDYNRPGIGTTEVERYKNKHIRMVVETKNEITIATRARVK